MHQDYRPVHASAPLKGVALVCFSVLIWSGWMVFSSYGVKGTLNAYDLTALRFGTAALVMLPVVWRKGLRFGPWGYFTGIFLAALMGALYNTITIYGMGLAPVSHAGIINTGMLIITALGGFLLMREPSTPLKLLGITISLAGIGCLLMANPAGAAYPHIHTGHVLFFVGGSMWALYALLVRHWQLDAWQVTAAVCFWSGLLFVPIYALFLPHSITEANLDEAVFQALYQGVLNSVFALLCYNRAVALLGATTSSAFLPLIPALATLAAMPLLHEYPTQLEWLGIALAAGGVLLSTGIVRLPRRR